MDITNYVYEPIDWQIGLGYKRVDSRCAARVHEGDRGVGFHQCNNNPKEEVEGFQFCTRHANKIRTSLGLHKSTGEYLYSVDIDYNNVVSVTKVPIITETDKIITLGESVRVFDYITQISKTKYAHKIFRSPTEAIKAFISKETDGIAGFKKEILESEEYITQAQKLLKS